MTATNPPPSPRERCPAWCVVDHQPDDHPDDRWHDSASSYVHVIVQDTDASDAGAPREFAIVTSRRFGTLSDWTSVGEPDRRGQHLRLSRESALRLTAALADHLRVVDENPGLRDPTDDTDESVDS